VHVSLSATLLWIRRFGNLHPLAALCEGRPLPPRCDPEVVAVSMTIERDPGEFGSGGHDGGQQQEGGGQTSMSAIRHAASFTRLGIREGMVPMRLDAHRPEWLPRP
jgi:hypothetical protein